MRNNLVKCFRLKLCWEQDKLAKELCVTRGAVSNWELGARNPSLSAIRNMKKIADNNGINFNTDDFIKGK